ncbi:MAG TPA: alpha-amylase/4-alpha-glucanotransferase domain-containing protein [Acidobacteriota bacterium]|nr:alpha-amylase/4-alpha-glucanotransferase domain-containing protein [Acidobacteriota bacterium]
MTKFQLAFGVHNHQPVGNFESVFEEAHKNAYLPFLRLLEKHEGVSISLHQSGILWEWQRTHQPEFFELVRRLIASGRVELMTGGFYEPILVAVPERDALGQIAMLTDYLGEQFNSRPTGLWLTERIWEPHLPKLLAAAGVTYLPIDDTHFIYSGFEEDQLTGPFVTESEGHAIVLLPIQKRLRYLVPFGTVDEVMAHLRAQAERSPSGMAVYADDGEKFGSWPNTHKHCYVDGWLDSLFEALEENSDWLEVIPLSRAAGRKPVGRAYLPSASYEEMLHWSLPPEAFVRYEEFEKWLKAQKRWDRYGRFVRGGHWRAFLAKYEDANLMHKKMLRVSRRLEEFERRLPDRRDETASVRDRLYTSQCNCPYWHGVFGGLYLSHIRQAVFSSMIAAERGLRQLLGEKGVSAEVYDFDADGCAEVLVANDGYTAVFRPGSGGMLLDFSLNEFDFALTDTLTRRREGYHLKLTGAVTQAAGGKTTSIHEQVLAKEDGLEQYLVEDWYLKRCFIDHFFSRDTTIESFNSGRYDEEGDFILEAYEHSWHRREGRLSMWRDGHLWRPEGIIPVRVEKHFDFEPGSDRVVVTYRLASGDGREAEVNFAVENNFNFLAGHASDRYHVIDNRRPADSYLDSIGRHDSARVLAMVDDYRGLAVAVGSERPAEIWHLPIFTVSLSEGGFEKVYQGTTIVHLYRVRLAAQPVQIRFSLIAGARDKVLEQAFVVPAVSD